MFFPLKDAIFNLSRKINLKNRKHTHTPSFQTSAFVCAAFEAPLHGSTTRLYILQPPASFFIYYSNKSLTVVAPQKKQKGGGPGSDTERQDSVQAACPGPVCTAWKRTSNRSWEQPKQSIGPGWDPVVTLAGLRPPLPPLPGTARAHPTPSPCWASAPPGPSPVPSHTLGPDPHPPTHDCTMSSPPAASDAPPVCPTCLDPITHTTSPRYALALWPGCRHPLPPRLFSAEQSPNPQPSLRALPNPVARARGRQPFPRLQHRRHQPIPGLRARARHCTRFRPPARTGRSPAERPHLAHPTPPHRPHPNPGQLVALRAPPSGRGPRAPPSCDGTVASRLRQLVGSGPARARRRTPRAPRPAYRCPGHHPRSRCRRALWTPPHSQQATAPASTGPLRLGGPYLARHGGIHSCSGARSLPPSLWGPWACGGLGSTLGWVPHLPPCPQPGRTSPPPSPARPLHPACYSAPPHPAPPTPTPARRVPAARTQARRGGRGAGAGAEEPLRPAPPPSQPDSPPPPPLFLPRHPLQRLRPNRPRDNFAAPSAHIAGRATPYRAFRYPRLPPSFGAPGGPLNPRRPRARMEAFLLAPPHAPPPRAGNDPHPCRGARPPSRTVPRRTMASTARGCPPHNCS